MLIHQPFGDYYGTYRAMEEAYDAGKLRAIGVSNFYPDRFIDLCEFVKVTPAVNQVETHVFHQQKTAHQYMRKYGTQHEAWGPFAEGRKDFFTNPVLMEIGAKHDKTAAQVALRFLIQSDVVAIPKSAHRERMEQNFHIFDFALDDEDMEKIAGLDSEESLFFSHYDPATVERLIGYGKSK
jgi:diketogulonate reductase-like aldo/keto reductase